NFVNKVAASGLVTLNLEEYYPAGDRLVYDIKENLFHGLMLREKDFREFIKTHDFTQYAGKSVAIICSADAIVPTWAYMLLSKRMNQQSYEKVFRIMEVLKSVLFTKDLSNIDINAFANERVVIKGCGDIDVLNSAYVELTILITTVEKSIMYGEPCYTVPVYK